MTKKQWHYTSTVYTEFLYNNVELDALYVEGTRVEGVDVKKYLPYGIVREVISRNGKLYVWSDFFALAFAKADEILKKWTELVSYTESRDVLLYFQALEDKSVMGKILQGKLSFGDDVFLTWIKACAGIAPIASPANKDQKGFEYYERESYLVKAKISNLLFNDPNTADEILSTHRLWCYLNADAHGVNRFAVVPTVREYLSVFPDHCCQAYKEYLSLPQDVIRYIDMSDLTLGHAELLMITFGDKEKSYPTIQEELGSIHIRTTWNEWVSPARKFKTLFNEDASKYFPDKVKRYTYYCSSEGITREWKRPYFDDYLHYAATCRHLTGDLEKARESLEMAVSKDTEEHFKLALAWKNIGDDSKRAAAIIKVMEKGTPLTQRDSALRALAHFEITGDMNKALYWARSTRPESIYSLFPPGITHDTIVLKFIDWCRSIQPLWTESP